jgi:hypothetical protein
MVRLSGFCSTPLFVFKRDHYKGCILLPKYMQWLTLFVHCLYKKIKGHNFVCNPLIFSCPARFRTWILLIQSKRCDKISLIIKFQSFPRYNHLGQLPYKSVLKGSIFYSFRWLIIFRSSIKYNCKFHSVFKARRTRPDRSRLVSMFPDTLESQVLT